MRPLLVAASVWPAAPPRHRVVAAVAASSPFSDTDANAVQSLWTGADDGGIVRWALGGREGSRVSTRGESASGSRDGGRG